MGEVKTFVSATRADMLPYWGSNPSRMITMFIARMPKTYDENPKKYHQFIQWFGTHYFMSAKFGGLIQMRLETNKDYYKTTSEQKIKANVDGTMRDLLKANGGLEHGTNHIDDKFKEATKNTIRYYGGDTRFPSGNRPFIATLGSMVENSPLWPISSTRSPPSKRASIRPPELTWTKCTRRRCARRASANC